MRIKLLAATIAAGLALVSFGAQAQTATNDSPELAQLRVQLAALQAKVDVLEWRDSTSPQPSAAFVAPPAPSRPLAAWADSTKVSGTLFVDFTNVNQSSHGAKTDASGTGLDVKRFYLSVDHRFDDVWSANLTTDFNYAGNDGETQLFVKKAYVQGAFSRLATLRAGSANMPWIPFVENWYGYRFVEKTLIDRMKFGNSADWGVHLLGADGKFNYQVSAVNGGGYRNPSRSNHADFAARAGWQPANGLMFALGGYDGDLGKDTQSTPALHRARRYDALAAWKRDGLRLGAEWFRANNWKNVSTPRSDAAAGWSLWGSYDFPRLSAFARYDHVSPSQRLDPNLRDTHWNAGIAFPLTTGIKLALAYKDERLGNRADIDVHSREIGAWGEASF